MKNVQQIRDRILRCEQQALMGIRSYASMTGGNEDVVARLQGDDGLELLAEVTDFLMEKLGHTVNTPASSPNSKTRRRARRVASG